jgi:hypothetical protein
LKKKKQNRTEEKREKRAEKRLCLLATPRGKNGAVVVGGETG